jgi:hypothetical protein
MIVSNAAVKVIEIMGNAGAEIFNDAPIKFSSVVL